MSNIPHYVCTRCNTPTKRADLTVKKSVFLEMGAGARTKRSRVMDWLCENCLDSDNEWRMPAWTPPMEASHGG